MIIILKNKESLIYKDFIFRCSIGKAGRTKNKKEGDKKTPKGIFTLGNLFYRYDKKRKPETKLKCTKIKKEMGWCDDKNSINNYNKLIKVKKNYKFSYEQLFRKSSEYDYLIPINYNTRKPIAAKGSAIFIHLSKNYKKTLGCISLIEKDFLILVKIINKDTKIKIC